MIFKPYEVTYSPFRSFTRQEWSMLEDHPQFPIAGIDLTRLQALNEPLTMEEVEMIYIPLIRLLQIHITHYRNLHHEREDFFRNPSQTIPYIIGIAGSVSVAHHAAARICRCYPKNRRWS